MKNNILEYIILYVMVACAALVIATLARIVATSMGLDGFTAFMAFIIVLAIQAVALANRELLSLYYGIGKYISENSRNHFWGTNAIETISRQLQQELPGLRGFSISNIKNMRLFYEAWEDVYVNRQLPAGEIETFSSIGFTHHCEILAKTDPNAL